MKIHTWSQIDEEQLNPLFARQVIHSERMTVARIHLARGAVVPEHSHDNEQISMVERGRLRFSIGGRQVLIEAGQALEIPSHVPHGVEALEDTLVTDLFAPAREDWRRGEDAYLRAK